MVPALSELARANAMNKNDINQYAHNGSVLIAVVKLNVTANIASETGLVESRTNSGKNMASFGVHTALNSSFFIIDSGDNTPTRTQTATDVSLDTSWHNYKMELDGTDIKLTIDGVLKATKTTNIPTVALQPYNFSQTQTAGAKSSAIRYMECYNT